MSFSLANIIIIMIIKIIIIMTCRKDELRFEIDKFSGVYG